MLRLTRDQRSTLFAGGTPGITGEGQCPIEAGYVHELSSRLSLRVTKVLRTPDSKKWVLRYEVTDRRDPVRNLRRTPPTQDFDAVRRSFDSQGFPQQAQDVRDRAAVESAYTGAPTSLADAGEAVDEVTLKRFSDEARRAEELRELRRREAWEETRLSDRLRAVEDDPVLHRHMRAIRHHIQAAEKRTGKRAA